MLQPPGYAVWSWDRWREMTGEKRPSVTSSQSGRAQLVELLPAPVERRVIDLFLGTPPPRRRRLNRVSNLK